MASFFEQKFEPKALTVDGDDEEDGEEGALLRRTLTAYIPCRYFEHFIWT